MFKKAAPLTLLQKILAQDQGNVMWLLMFRRLEYIGQKTRHL